MEATPERDTVVFWDMVAQESLVEDHRSISWADRQGPARATDAVYEAAHTAMTRIEGQDAYTALRARCVELEANMADCLAACLGSKVPKSDLAPLSTASRTLDLKQRCKNQRRLLGTIRRMLRLRHQSERAVQELRSAEDVITLLRRAHYALTLSNA